MSKPKHILVLRFSALGDIAMTVPVIKNVLHQNADLEITYASVPFAAPFFSGIERLHFYPIDIKKYTGVFGLRKLAKILKNSIPFDAVADIHNVLRTKLIRLFLNNSNTKVIEKGRQEKAMLTRKKHKILRQLKPMHDRYADVFKEMGIPVILNKEQGIIKPVPDHSFLPFLKSNDNLIGIAPFAKYNAKLYPYEKMQKVIKELLANDKNKIFVFGTKEETAKFMIPFSEVNVINMGGKLLLQQELNVISQLDVMLTMDSANMHIASFLGTPVVSIWGGTHPFAGFYGWGQDTDNIIQTDLPCRPSSVYGKKECPIHGVEGCMQEITPEMITEKITQLLARRKNL